MMRSARLVLLTALSLSCLGTGGKVAAAPLQCMINAPIHEHIDCVVAHGDFASLKEAMLRMLPDAPVLEAGAVLARLENQWAEGKVMAMLGLAIMYENGLGVLKNDGVAVGYYLDAAKSGSTDGMLQAAMSYCEGRVPAPRLECYFWLRQATEHGRYDVLIELARQILRLDNDTAAAQAYLQQAIALGVPEAQAALLDLAAGRL